MRIKSMFRWAAGTAVGITLAGVVLAREVTNPVPSTAKSIEAGRQLFQKYCKGVTARTRPVTDRWRRRMSILPTSQTPNGIRRHRRRDLLQHPRRHRSEVRYEIVEKPDDRCEIWSVVNYLRSIAAKPSQP